MHRPTRRFLALLAAAAMAAATVLVGAPAGATPAHAGSAATPTAAAASDATITIDGASGGKTFDGVGGISAGASSRLLYDYPPRQRSQLLDYLFTPNYGASLQILKVEIGGDTDSTDGSEASHERTRGVVDCNAGYEWWLMEQARKRNPNIKFYGLEWVLPSWFTGGVWSQDNIHYLQSWLACAHSHNLTINYLGGWNEKGFVASWYEQLAAALAKSDPQVKIVADDGWKDWSVATALKNDPAFDKAVDVVGHHDPCNPRTLYQYCPSSADAESLGKPLWASETSSEGHDSGSGALARSLNRDYLDGGITAELFWSVISAYYSDLPIADTGLMLADTPWSGHYDIGSSIWAIAQTTQFAKPGWRYLDTGSGYFGQHSDASIVSLRAPHGNGYSTVIETMDAVSPQTFTFDVTGGLSTGTVHVWSTDLTSRQQSDYLQHVANITPDSGSYTLTLQPGHVYTLTTTTGQRHGDAGKPARSSATQMALPFRQNFEKLAADKLAPYFSDINGGYNTAPCQGGRKGMCYEQEVPSQPIGYGGAGKMDPTSVAGDPRWWGDYRVSTDVLLNDATGAEVIGRVDNAGAMDGYHLKVSRTGAWQLYSNAIAASTLTLASGTTGFDPSTWHQLSISLHGTDIRAFLDGKKLADVHDDSHDAGQIGIRTGGFAHAQFDNVRVTPTAAAPPVVPHNRMTATATTAHTAPYRGYTYNAYRAIDDRTDTLWESEFDPKAPLPQSITLDMRRRERTDGLSYRPRIDDTSGWITEYRVLVSNDGQNFTQVAQGSWPLGAATKFATWRATRARYVRLVALQGDNDLASAAELNVLSGPLPDRGADAYPSLAPRTAMSATNYHSRVPAV